MDDAPNLYRLRGGSRKAFHMNQLQVSVNYFAHSPCDRMTARAD
jgi:hypothetical protein